MESMNSVLQKFFNLPPAVRMLLAVAGFGSLASIIYFLLPALNTKQGRIWLLIIAAIGLVLVLLIWGIRRAFFGRKSKKLSGALESQGPTRGDEAEQERIYREKFRGKLTELKTNGLSVYKLPWFVLMGEPGCGKTASLIHSGLDFPLGKDEVPGFGGTRNYNWWFTNDAVILDTAGRIAFQEEGTTDKVEWEFFLKLLKLNRPRCPINGIIIALPADKLLRDTSEERAQKATVLRERLRQVHQALGVRFPTFVLVTKMDLVGGFGEFFEEIRVDLQQRNQMFGWSRPGEFQEPFDPAQFPDTFDMVYYRLREWSMRYLQRKATEEELGLVVTFPEAFRQVRDPLNDFISTIFQKSPLLEPPFFRGFYFTSAVQEGAPIFDVFARTRPGLTLPERPTKAVDSKAFFIHDFYEKKVFAEHGLVFRSAQHVTLNRRMRRMVAVGSVVLLILMMLLFTFGSLGVSDLVTQPRVDCKKAADAITVARQHEAPFDKLADNLQLAKRLQQHFLAYDRPWTGLRARTLFIGANIGVPRDDVRLTHARFVLDTVVRPILTETARRLTTPEDLTKSPEAYDHYVAALTAYTRWYGQMVGSAGLKPLDRAEADQCGAELGKLLEFLNQPEPVRKDGAEQFTAALASLSAKPRAFGREILGETVRFKPEEAATAIKAGVKNLTERWLPLTRLEPAPQDKFLTYWFGLAQRVGKLHGLYQEALTLAPRFKDNGTYEDAAQKLAKLTEGSEYLSTATTAPPDGTIARAYYDLRNYLTDQSVPQTDAKRVLRFKDQIGVSEQQWDTGFGPVLKALREGAPKEDSTPQKDIYVAIADARTQLRKSYEKSWGEILDQLSVPKPQEPADYYAGELKLFRLDERTEADPTFDKPKATIQLAPYPLGRNEELKDYLAELRQTVTGGAAAGQLDNLADWPALLAEGQGGAPSGQHLNAWFSAARRDQGSPSEENIRQSSQLLDQPFWQPVALYGLAQGVWQGYQGRMVGTLLAHMQERCDAATKEKSLPGVAQLMPGFDKPAQSLPFQRCSVEKKPVETKEPAEKPKEEPEADWRRPRGEKPAEPNQPAGPGATRSDEHPPLVSYHTREFLYNTLKAYYEARAALGKQGERSTPVVAALDRATDAYIDHYFLDWNAAYDTYCELLDDDTLTFLRACAQGAYDWPAFQAALEKIGPRIGDQLGSRFEAVTREVVLCGDAFETNARGEALFNRLDERLKALGPQSNLQRRLDDLGRRGATLRRNGDPITLLGDEYTKAWMSWVQQVKQRGADPRGAVTPPDRAQLQKSFEEMIRPRTLSPEQFRLTAPLLDIAAYGEDLLRHHLDGQLASLFGPVREHYPVVADARDTDPFPRLEKLAESAAGPDDVLKLLRDVDHFQQDYGKLVQALHADRESPYTRALDQCAAWVTFLYGPNAKQLQQEVPPPLKVKWATSKHEGTVSAGSIYTRVTITLPLLKETGREAAGPLDADARSGFGESLPPKAIDALAKKTDWPYAWNLFQKADYPRPGVRVSQKNPTAKAEYPAEIATDWKLPGNPAALLLVVGADPANRLSGEQWIIPVQMTIASETIGFDIAIQFERVFPGPIAPVSDPGKPPPMQTAQKYISTAEAPASP